MLTTCAASWTCGIASCQVVSASIPNSARIAESAKRRMQAQARTEARKLTDDAVMSLRVSRRSEEHTSELQSLMRISSAVFCLKKKTNQHKTIRQQYNTNR